MALFEQQMTLERRKTTPKYAKIITKSHFSNL